MHLVSLALILHPLFPSLQPHFASYLLSLLQVWRTVVEHCRTLSEKRTAVTTMASPATTAGYQPSSEIPKHQMWVWFGLFGFFLINWKWSGHCLRSGTQTQTCKHNWLAFKPRALPFMLMAFHQLGFGWKTSDSLAQRWSRATKLPSKHLPMVSKDPISLEGHCNVHLLNQLFSEVHLSVVSVSLCQML